MAYEASEEIVDLIWSDLAEQVARARVAEVARKVAADIGDAKITTFIPLFVRRMSVDRLRAEVVQRV